MIYYSSCRRVGPVQSAPCSSTCFLGEICPWRSWTSSRNGRWGTRWWISWSIWSVWTARGVNTFSQWLSPSSEGSYIILLGPMCILSCCSLDTYSWTMILYIGLSIYSSQSYQVITSECGFFLFDGRQKRWGPLSKSRYNTCLLYTSPSPRD